MKRLLLVVVGLALLVGAATVWGAYSRDITGDLRRNSSALNQAILVALEYMISDGIPVTETSTATPVEKTPTHLAAKIIGTPGTPIVLAADGTFFTSATLQAGRAAAANASLITIGGNTAYTSQRAGELAPGDERTIVAVPGTKLDLNDWYIDGVDTDDGVRIEYIAP